MCGFVGFTGLREQREAILHRMADRIIHRGPDMEGYHISGNDPRSAIALGFRRLSIIDLAAGKQPMYNEDGTVVCVFNGEIYNFMELRTELQAKGHIFQTHCDTEVILHGYEEYGTKLAGMLRGMFAFVVWDTKTNEMYGARDIFGIKPGDMLLVLSDRGFGKRMLSDDVERQGRAGKGQKLLPMNKTGETGTQLAACLNVTGAKSARVEQRHGHVTVLNMDEIAVERRTSKGQLLINVLLDDVVEYAALTAETNNDN